MNSNIIGDIIGTLFIFGLLSIPVSVFWSLSDNYEIKHYNSPGKVEFTVVEASSQQMRGEAKFEGSGSFLGWTQKGSANFGSGQGRLAVKTTLDGEEKYFDIQITRSQYLSLRNKDSDSITLNVIYEPCDVPEIQKELVCYRLTDNGRYVSTSQEFTAWPTIYKIDIDSRDPWINAHKSKRMYNGYFGESTSEKIIQEAANNVGKE